MTTNETYQRQRLLLEELSNAFGPTGHEAPSAPSSDAS